MDGGTTTSVQTYMSTTNTTLTTQILRTTNTTRPTLKTQKTTLEETLTSEEMVALTTEDTGRMIMELIRVEMSGVTAGVILGAETTEEVISAGETLGEGTLEEEISGTWEVEILEVMLGDVVEVAEETRLGKCEASKEGRKMVMSHKGCPPLEHFRLVVLWRRKKPF